MTMHSAELQALIKRERKSSQVFRKLACDATGQTSAQVVASSELPPVDSIYRVSYYRVH